MTVGKVRRIRGRGCTGPPGCCPGCPRRLRTGPGACRSNGRCASRPVFLHRCPCPSIARGAMHARPPASSMLPADCLSACPTGVARADQQEQASRRSQTRPQRPKRRRRLSLKCTRTVGLGPARKQLGQGRRGGAGMPGGEATRKVRRRGGSWASRSSRFLPVCVLSGLSERTD